MDEYDCVTPRGLGGMDSSSIQHFLDVLPYLFYHLWCDSLKPLPEWFTIGDLNDVFFCIGATHFVWFQGENQVEL